ncbi:MAG TPA: hypothetical protein VJB08_06760 [Candidatus Nanoarchaeia archaeon]|nr:hypothetical protein [Candidatus Nanoarchaeia archaeon]
MKQSRYSASNCISEGREKIDPFVFFTTTYLCSTPYQLMPPKLARRAERLYHHMQRCLFHKEMHESLLEMILQDPGHADEAQRYRENITIIDSGCGALLRGANN